MTSQTNNIQYIQNRRSADRTTPYAHECVAHITFLNQEPVEAIVCDVSSTGIGLLVDDDALAIATEQLQVTYQNTNSSGTIVNRVEYSSDCNRLGIRWDEAPTPARPQDSRARYLIFVKTLSDEMLALEQFRPSGRIQIKVSQVELAEIVSALSKPEGSTPENMRRQIGPSVIIRRLSADDSFGIQQGETLIFGDGDIRRFLQPTD